jgi:hypothetical protein
MSRNLTGAANFFLSIPPAGSSPAEQQKLGLNRD